MRRRMSHGRERERGSCAGPGSVEEVFWSGEENCGPERRRIPTREERESSRGEKRDLNRRI